MKILKILQNITQKTNKGVSGVRDPICGMNIDLEKTQFKSTYNDKKYGFCSTGCKAEFDKNPNQYI